MCTIPRSDQKTNNDIAKISDLDPNTYDLGTQSTLIRNAALYSGFVTWKENSLVLYKHIVIHHLAFCVTIC